VQYKVWLTIEEIDEEVDHYEDVGLPDPLGAFDDLKSARILLAAVLACFAPDEIRNSDNVAFLKENQDVPA
jgi:hypothetical protein